MDTSLPPVTHPACEHDNYDLDVTEATREHTAYLATCRTCGATWPVIETHLGASTASLSKRQETP